VGPFKGLVHRVRTQVLAALEAVQTTACGSGVCHFIASVHNRCQRTDHADDAQFFTTFTKTIVCGGEATVDQNDNNR
jgi:hypothetical protein